MQERRVCFFFGKFNHIRVASKSIPRKTTKDLELVFPHQLLGDAKGRVQQGAAGHGEVVTEFS